MENLRTYKFFGSEYTLEYEHGAEGIDVILCGRKQRLNITPSCHQTDQFDVTEQRHSITVRDLGTKLEIHAAYSSNLWSKEILITATNEQIEFQPQFKGSGDIAEVAYFEHIGQQDFEEHFYETKHFNDKGSTTAKEYAIRSPIAFRNVFCPEPNSHSKQEILTFEDCTISVNSDLENRGGNFVANPGILCFAFKVCDDFWFTMGVAAPRGDNEFAEYEYSGGKEFGLRLRYWGMKSVVGIFKPPAILFRPSRQIIEGLTNYVKTIDERGCLPQKKFVQSPTWWKMPIICGWGYQSMRGDLFRKRSQRPADNAVYLNSSRKIYEDFIAEIDRHRLPFGTLIIDARWSREDELLVPDEGRWHGMRDFVDALHVRGKRVLAWWGPWRPDGFLDEEMFKFEGFQSYRTPNRPGRLSKFGDLHAGTYIAPDPTLASVRKKIELAVEFALGNDESGLNLDGFKIDHVASMPALFGLRYPSGSVRKCGLELLREMYQLIYGSAKHVKSDALIIGQSPNPYFRDCFDMLRLGDIYSRQSHSVFDEMLFRKNMATIACPNALIDCDGWPLPSTAAAKEYLIAQTELGVPSLYYSGKLDLVNAALGDQFMRKLRDQWSQYIKDIEIR